MGGGRVCGRHGGVQGAGAMTGQVWRRWFRVRGGADDGNRTGVAKEVREVDCGNQWRLSRPSSRHRRIYDLRRTFSPPRDRPFGRLGMYSV